MAKTGCACGVGLWNGYGPGGVNWDIFPLWQFKEVAYENPKASIMDVIDLTAERFYNSEWHDLWLCRRCKRIQIWKIDGLYVSYKPVDYIFDVPIDDIKKMEEWVAINDYDLEHEEYSAVDMIEKLPFRPYRYFLSEDKSRVYVYNTETDGIEWVYQEETREIEKGLYRDERGLYRDKYIKKNFYKHYIENGVEVEYEHRNRLLSDAVYGFIMGDALGVPYEFKRRGTFECKGMDGYGTYNKPAGTWSDDTSMMLATCLSLKENNLKVNIDDMKSKFLKWLDDGEFTADGEVFDVGITTSNALRTGVPESGERSNGNGSLMRVLPLAFVDCTDDEIRAVSGITHNHWIAKEACVIYVNLIKEYINQEYDNLSDYKSLRDLIRSIPEMPAPFDRLCKLSSLKEEDIKSTGYVVDTLEAALWCMLQERDRWSSKYAKTLLRAVNLGGDTDTIAAVTGGLAGLEYSFDELPDDWTWKIKNNKLIQNCLW